MNVIISNITSWALILRASPQAALQVDVTKHLQLIHSPPLLQLHHCPLAAASDEEDSDAEGHHCQEQPQSPRHHYPAALALYHLAYLKQSDLAIHLALHLPEEEI